jgi:hypothetical protein
MEWGSTAHIAGYALAGVFCFVCDPVGSMVMAETKGGNDLAFCESS